jgi:LPPG:FO 2-phospho-L-lactate transferase
MPEKIKNKYQISTDHKIVILAGGVGGAKMVEGFYRAMEHPENLSVIINTGDDRRFFGLYISPDVDIITYTLAGVVDKKKRWGYSQEKFTTLRALSRFYPDTWFNIGDKDLATHLYRNDLLQQGHSLTEITKEIATKFGIKANLYPMTDDWVPTMLETDVGLLDFETYYVKHRCSPKIKHIYSENIQHAHLNPEIREKMNEADIIVIAPSNPFVSIFPILNIPKMRDSLKSQYQKGIAISPLINNFAIKGPLREMLEQLQIPASTVEIARLYEGLIKYYIVDEQDESTKKEIEKLGINSISYPILLNNLIRKKALAEKIVKEMK